MISTLPEKSTLRRAVLARLRALTPEAIAAQSASLRRQLADLLQTAQAQNIAIYYPQAHEVNLLPLLEEYPQHHFHFPRCRARGTMDFHLVRDLTADIEPGAHGIPAPRSTCPLIPPDELDLIIVPGTAFTPDGKRLGYGGGYYDRYLPRCPQACILALALQEQILTDLPTEPHDLIIPCIISSANSSL